MHRTFITSFKISFAESANTIIYFLKRIPLIKKIVPDSLYEDTNGKIIFGVLGEILNIIGLIIKKFLYVGLMVLLPSYFLSKESGAFAIDVLHIIFFLNIIFGSIVNTLILDVNNKSAFNMIILLKANARKYYLSLIVVENVLDFLFLLLPMKVAGLISGFSGIEALYTVIIMTSFKLMGEAFSIFLFDKFKIIISKKPFKVFIFGIVCLFLAYGLPFLEYEINFKFFFFNIISVLLVLILGALSTIYLWNYKKYIVIAKRILNRDDILKGRNIKVGIAFSDVTLKEDDFSNSELSSNEFSNKEGYEYLNALFFKRHKKVLLTPIKVSIGIILIAFICAIIFMVIIPNSKDIIGNYILNHIPLFVFLMYSLSSGERICRAMFYNCDLSLLKYGYYRESKALLRNFTIRLKYAVILNVIPAFALCISLFVILLFAGFSDRLLNTVPLFLCIICLSFFFSIHHLFMYYTLQPYTEQLTVKSPLYQVVNSIVYFLCYFCFKLETASHVFTLSVIGGTILYMVIALVLTYRLAPGSFRLK